MPRRAAIAAAGAAGCAALTILTWFVAFHLAFGGRVDRGIMRGFTDLSRPRVNALAERIATLCNPSPWVFLAGGVLAIALVRRRGRSATAIATILVGANGTTHLLKPMLAFPRPGPLIDGHASTFVASWPSGHATAAMSLTLCLVLAVPARLRPLSAAAGAVFTIAVVDSFLTLGWHFPSDVLGGFLIAVTWTLAAAAAVWASEPEMAAHGPTRARRPSMGALLAPSALAGLAMVALVALVAVARPHAVVEYVRNHHAFTFGAVAIATAVLLLSTGMMLALSRSRPTGSDRAPTAAPRRRSQPG